MEIKKVQHWTLIVSITLVLGIALAVAYKKAGINIAVKEGESSEAASQSSAASVLSDVKIIKEISTDEVNNWSQCIKIGWENLVVQNINDYHIKIINYNTGETIYEGTNSIPSCSFSISPNGLYTTWPRSKESRDIMVYDGTAVKLISSPTKPDNMGYSPEPAVNDIGEIAWINFVDQGKYEIRLANTGGKIDKLVKKVDFSKYYPDHLMLDNSGRIYVRTYYKGATIGGAIGNSIDVYDRTGNFLAHVENNNYFIPWFSLFRENHFVYSMRNFDGSDISVYDYDLSSKKNEKVNLFFGDNKDLAFGGFYLAGTRNNIVTLLSDKSYNNFVSFNQYQRQFYFEDEKGKHSIFNLLFSSDNLVPVHIKEVTANNPNIKSKVIIFQDENIDSNKRLFYTLQAIVSPASSCLKEAPSGIKLTKPADKGSICLDSEGNIAGYPRWPDIAKFSWNPSIGDVQNGDGFKWCTVGYNKNTHPTNSDTKDVYGQKIKPGKVVGGDNTGKFCFVFSKASTKFKKWIWCTEAGCNKEGF